MLFVNKEKLTTDEVAILHSINGDSIIVISSAGTYPSPTQLHFTGTPPLKYIDLAKPLPVPYFLKSYFYRVSELAMWGYGVGFPGDFHSHSIPVG